jgi:hypothetical protein
VSDTTGEERVSRRCLFVSVRVKGVPGEFSEVPDVFEGYLALFRHDTVTNA